MVLEQDLRLPHNPHDKTIMRKLLSTFLLLASLPLVAANGWTLPARATAVVTGGTKGIGRAIVEELAGVHKCRVLTCARNPDELKEFVAQRHAKGMDVEGVVADVATIEGRTTLITNIEAFVDGQGLDILVNNVGTNIRKPSIEYTQDEIEFLLNNQLMQHVWSNHGMSQVSQTFGWNNIVGGQHRIRCRRHLRKDGHAIFGHEICHESRNGELGL
jgi:hypothetical protein